MSAPRIARLCLLSIVGSLALAVTGCANSVVPNVGSGSSSSGSGSTIGGSPTARVTLGGRVYGGQQPITGAAMTLWAAGTSASYGTGATSIATTTTDSNGNFSFNNGGLSPCTTGQYLYITSVGGNPGAGANQYAAEIAALPAPCSASTANTYVVVNEVTTVASVTALQQFMSIAPGGSPAWTIGAPSANVTGLANAFTQVGNLVTIGTGLSGATTATNAVNSVTYTTTITPDSNKINALADVLAACINTNGTGTGTGTCAGLFTATTPATTGSASPTDTIQVAYDLATNAGGVNLPTSPASLSASWVSAQSPFQPYNATPTDWTIDVNWTASNGSSTVGTVTAASVAIDQSGNIWTASLNTVASPGPYTPLQVTEFNPAGLVQFTPPATAPVVGGWNYATCGATCNTAATLLGTKQGDALAIDTNGNAWATSYNGSTYTIVTNQPEQVVVKVTPGTGAANAYLVGSQAAGLTIDGSNDLYVGDDSSTTTNRYYEAELVASGTTPYSTFETGTGRTAGNGGYYIGGSVDETANQYVWPWLTGSSGGCETTIPRISNTPSLGSASTVGTTTALPVAACYLVTDASGNAWASAAPGTTAGVNALEYVNVLGNTTGGIASPTVTKYTQGANGVATGAELAGGLYDPQGMAIDGEGNLWVVNQSGSAGGGISEFAPSNNGTTLTPLSPSGTGVWGFFSNTTIGTPIGAAIDGSGNVWFKTKGGSSLYYLVGAAAPVITPLAANVKAGFIGERPGATLLASLTPSLSFSSLTTSNQSQTATVTNTGTATVKITGTTITGTNSSDFSVTGGTCTPTATLAVGASCSITVTFISTTAGSFTAALNVNGNAVVSPGAATLTGNSDTPVPFTVTAGSGSSPTPPSITFPSIVAGSVAPGQALVVTNNGSVPLSLSIGFNGTGSGLFNETNNCGSSLAAGASCNVGLQFAPLVAGSYSASLTLTDNAGSGSQVVSVSGTATPFTINVNTTTASAWVIDDGAITFNWNSSSGNLVSWMLDGYADQLVDITTTTNGQPYGLYMDNTGNFENGSIPTGGTAAASTVSCTIVGGTVSGPTTCTTGTGSTPYFDWAITTPDTANSGNAYTYVQHWVVFPNDPGVHVYTQLVHNATDIAGGVGQMQWVFRDNQSTFTHSYEVNSGLGILGVEDTPRPALADTESTDPGRTVQNAAEDLHGFSDIPGTFGRYFDTKYDFAGYEYLHHAHGLYGQASSGTNYGVWTVIPKLETLVGGPTKQDLYFTGNIDMMEAYSDHEDLPINMNTAAGVVYNRLFGPYYYHVNVLGKAYNQTGNILATQADMYADAISAEAAIVPEYDNEPQLVAAGYVPSTGRGSVSIQMNGVTSAPNTAWAVLSDPNTNFQVSCNGLQYWADIGGTGSYTFTGVAPGTYRLSVYVLGQWGEYRQDGIVVTANNTTTVPAATFVPENFGGTNPPVFTVGTPDRSSHEFLHGHNTTTGNDDREYWGNWNYWADFAANSGAVVYYATAVGSTPATNNLQLWNYDHWGSSFDPGLYDPNTVPTPTGGTAVPDNTYGYNDYSTPFNNSIPTYVAGLTGATGTDGVTTPIPAWQVYFATPANVATQQYVELSISAACAYGSYVVTLNGQQRIWHYTNYSDCVIRSGLSGYTQWFVMEWPVSALNQTVGGSNEITVSMSQQYGAEDDAWRLELTNTSSNPTVTGWNDYTYVSGAGTPATTPPANSSGLYNNDAIPNP